MTPSEELRLWVVHETGNAEPLLRAERMPTELALEELLVRSPQILGDGIKLVGRQTPTQTGWLDLLAVDQDGRLVVYELKRGVLARDAVTQVLDYASSLDEMDAADLAGHIAERSGNGGIQGIDDFEQWYADNFGGDLSLLMPPRMVLVGLGVDPVAERMAQFVSSGSVDLSVVTLHGFMHGEGRLLARQLEVEPGQDRSRRDRSATVRERRLALREYLTQNGYADLFDRVRADIRELLPDTGVWEEPGRKGIRFDLKEPDKTYKGYFGVYAGYSNPGCSVSILPQAIGRGTVALQELQGTLELSKWPHGGSVCEFLSEELWTEHRPTVLKFVEAVMDSRENAIDG